jgi:DNA-binding IclR family transcriptional regulator
MGHMSEIELDEVDLQLLNRVAEFPGSSVVKIVKTLDCQTARHLRRKLDRLDSLGYVRLDRETFCRKVLVFPTEAGKASVGWSDATTEGAEVTST